MATNHLAMSDEDFLKEPLPVTGEASPISSNDDDNNAATPDNADGAEPTPPADADAGKSAEQDATPPADNQSGSEDDENQGNAAPSDPAKDPDGKPAEGKDPAENSKSGEPAAPGSEAKPVAKQEEATPDYAAFYAAVMKPIKANGKEIALKSPEEAIQLMQMGANYTRKMQEIAPHRKLLTMLSNNGLDEDKISFLIDLDKGDKEAIKRFIKDKGIDPLDIDVTTEPAYQGGSHKVSDQEQAFRNQLEELSSTPEGVETIQTIESWDQASKDKLWQQPELFAIIDAQRKTGIYSRITDEIDRMKTMGQMPSDKSFLDAYSIAGDALQKAGAFADIIAKSSGGNPGNSTPAGQDTSAGKPTPDPVAVRAKAPTPDVDASSKAAAASPSRATPGAAKSAVNVLAMSDEEFLKHAEFQGRV